MTEPRFKSGLQGSPRRREILTFAMILGLAVCPLMLPAQSVSLAWNPSTDPNVVGYALYYGTDGVTFTNRLDAGSNTSLTVNNLSLATTNYFEVTDYYLGGVESVPSAPVQYYIANPSDNTIAVSASPSAGGSVSGGGTFATGSSQTVTATANSGYTFANWTVNGNVVSSAASYSFTLTANQTLVANFTANPVNYTIAVSASPSAGGSVSGGGTFALGSSQTVIATANSGYTFANWTANGNVVSSSASYTFTLTANQTLVANFTANPVNYTIAVNASPSAGGSASGGGTFASGSSRTVTATANSGYTFTNWTANGNVVSSSASYTFTLSGNTTLVANFKANTANYTVAVSASPSADGTVSGGGTFASGSSQTVTATPNSGYSFTNWTANGNVVSASASYTFTLTGNTTLVANFTAAPVNYTIAVSASPSAAGTVSGGGTFGSGSFQTVTATANSGYTFANWTVNGSVVSSTHNYGFTLTTNVNLVANFTVRSSNYTVAVSASPSAGGSVSGGGTFASGSSQTVTATANSGYTFANWTVNGSVVSSATSYNFTLTGNTTLVANFTANTVNYTIAVSASPSAGGTVSGGGTFASGSSQTVTATANSGYTFANWTVNGSVVSSSASYTFTLTGNTTLVANFTANTVNYTIAVSASPSVGGTVSGGGTFASGSSQTVTATANSGYTFANWTINGSVVSSLASYTFTLTGNTTLVANFTANTVNYTIAVSASPSVGGTVSGGGTFASGSSQTVTATANSGYTFANWTINGSGVSSLASYTFTLTGNTTLVANFTLNQAGSSNAVPITVVNASFESPATAQGMVASVADGWVPFNGNPYGVYNPANGLYTNEVDDVLPSPAQGAQVLWIDSTNYVAQILTNALEANQTYTLSGTIGNRGDGYGLLATDQPYVELVAGNTIIAENTDLPHPAPGSFLPWTISYTAAATGFPSGPLQIQLGQHGAGEVNFDNIALTSSTGGSTNDTGTTPSTNEPPATVEIVTAQTNATTDFTLLMSGNGTFAPNLHGMVFEAGKRYTLIAYPAKGYVFANWLSNGVVVTNTSRISFLLGSNVVLQANFIPNPFIPTVGAYHGLFYVPNDAAEESSGSFSATVTSAGAYSAHIGQGAASYSFAGTFSPLTGAAFKSIPRRGLTPINVQLLLDMSNGPITGSISDGAWTADLVANPSIYSRTNPAPQAGKYTLLIPGSDNASAQPGGHGFGAVTVNTLGNVSLSGTLGDGTPFVSSSVVAGQGQWPFYISLYGGKGSILGWLSFTNDGISGEIDWFKLPQTTAKLYPGGFTYGTNVIGSAYHYTNQIPVLGSTDCLLALLNGDLTEGITNDAALGPSVPATDPSNIKLSLMTSSGMFSGSTMNPEPGKPITVHGIVLQNQNFGAGYFLGTNQTGSVLLSPK